MNCSKCGSLVRELEDEYKGKRYTFMFWCDECEEEVFPEGDKNKEVEKMKATKTIVVARIDDTPKLVIVTDDKKGEFLEATAMETFIKAYAGIYKAICMELYSDQKFLCSHCDLLLYFTHFSGIVMGGEGVPEYLCLKCAVKMGNPQKVKEDKLTKMGLVKGKDGG